MSQNSWKISGLTSDEVKQSALLHGTNATAKKSEYHFLKLLLSLVSEPMVILLLISSFIYFISGKIDDGIFLCVAILFVSAISVYQERRSRNAIELLKQYTRPNCKVIRNSKKMELPVHELVIDDWLLAEEGDYVAADGIVVESHDFSVNEALLTGESMPVFKTMNNLAMQGSNVVSGSAVIQVSAIGANTQMGRIGLSLHNIPEEKTPLELQINRFVKKMVFVGGVVFFLVWAFNYYHTQEFVQSLLKALTIAMSILPEEIPVAFATFMALGAWRLMKMGIIVKQMKTVETLGSASVICIDKTGTITENRMELVKIYLHGSNTCADIHDVSKSQSHEIISMAMWSSEPEPFDPMEIALHKAYANIVDIDERVNYEFVHEYPLSGKPPMMTHIFRQPNGEMIVACKGAPEALIRVCQLSDQEAAKVHAAIDQFAGEGYRVLGVGQAKHIDQNFPKNQEEFAFKFIGLVAFYDPPLANINEVLQGFYKAGINVKIITGDNAITTAAIAKKINFHGTQQALSGEDAIQLTDEQLKVAAMQTNIFTRMFPEAKLRVINALKASNKIVAMTGDGVNDGPALKAAHIGIAMGKKGTAIARDAASLILVDDDLSKMIDAIGVGRKIYTNLKKAVQYIIAIHIPIILTVLIPLVLGWIYPNIFSPVHVIFLELIMGPTCSIIYENEPMESNAMIQPPRLMSKSFFNMKELSISIMKGLMITAGVLFAYRLSVNQQGGEAYTRTMVFATLVLSNIFLTLENRSLQFSVLKTIHYPNKLVIVMIAITVLLSGVLIYIEPFSAFFGFVAIAPLALLQITGIALISVFWYELVKWRRRSKP